MSGIPNADAKGADPLHRNKLPENVTRDDLLEINRTIFSECLGKTSCVQRYDIEDGADALSEHCQKHWGDSPGSSFKINSRVLEGFSGYKFVQGKYDATQQARDTVILKGDALDIACKNLVCLGDMRRRIVREKRRVTP